MTITSVPSSPQAQAMLKSPQTAVATSLIKAEARTIRRDLAERPARANRQRCAKGDENQWQAPTPADPPSPNCAYTVGEASRVCRWPAENRSRWRSEAGSRRW